MLVANSSGDDPENSLRRLVVSMRESTVLSGSVAELITAAEHQIVVKMITETLTLGFVNFLQK